MASGFNHQDGSECDGCHRQDKPHITYRVEEDQQLCDDCAERKKDSIKPVKRKVWWSCEKHPEKEAEVFCETHQAAICHICAITKTHRPCDMKDIHDEIDERKRFLVDKVAEGKSKGKEIMECELTVVRRSGVVDEHLEKLYHEINVALNKEIGKLTYQKEKKAAMINMEADNEIAKIVEKINKTRHERLLENYEDYNRKTQSIEDEKDALNRDLEHVKQKFVQESHLRKNKYQNLSKSLDEALMKAEKLVNEERDLLTEFKHITQSLENGLKTEISVENVSNMASIIEKISFRKSDDGQGVGRLLVPSNEWEKEIEFHLKLGNSMAIGTVKNTKIVFREVSGGSVYVENVKEKTSRKVVDGKNPYHICSCTTLVDGRIVCGTFNAEIVIYNPTWKHQSTFVLTRERKGVATWVTTDRDGMIVAVVYESDTIYIYNPDDGAFVRSVTFPGGPISKKIGCLSSGDMVVCSKGQDVCVVDGLGVVKSTNHFHGKHVRSIAVDKLTDLIYAMYYGGSEYSVDVMSPNGEVRAERIVTSTAGSLLSYMYFSITDTGTLILCINSKILLYKKMLTPVNELAI